MPKSRIPSPARSQSALVTPRRAKTRGPRSVGSPARSDTSVRLTSVIQNFKDKNMDSFHLSPLNSRRSVLNDNTDIVEPKRNSWWKKLNDTSRDIMEVLENDKQEEPYNVIEEYMDVDVLSQEKKNPAVDLPDSSDNESINSIVIPQRKLFSQKENQPQPQKKFAQLLGPRESMAKLNKTSGASDKSEQTMFAGTKKLFGQSSKPRSKPAFPTELLRFSPDKSVNKTAGEIKGQVRNLFGNRAGVKKKNNFADFIASESDEEPEIQPKVFGFQKKSDVPSRRVSTASRGNRDHSPTSSVTTDIDMEDWKMLPSSTMVQTQLEAMITDSPAKKARLSKLSEGKESEAVTNSTAITNKTKQSNKSITSRNKSKMSISKNSINKSKTLPKRKDNEVITNTVVNEEVPEHVDQEVENDENEVSLHYSDDDPQEEIFELKNKNDKSKQSNISVSSKNKSKASPKSNGPLTKSKISVSAQKSITNEADVAEENDSEKIVNKSKDKNDSKRGKRSDDEVQEDKSAEVANEILEMEHESQNSDVEQEDEEQVNESQEVDYENQESEIEQEVDYENQESEIEQEDDEENESHEIEEENRDSEVEQEDAEQESVSQEIEDKDQESEDEEQENGIQEVNTEDPINDDKQNDSREENQEQEIENMAIENEAVANGTVNKSKLSNQSVTSVNKSKTAILINKSKISLKANVSQNVKKTALNEGVIESDNEGNVIFSHVDGDAQGIDNMEQNNGNNVTNETKHSNDSVTSKNKSKMSVSKNIINNNSTNKSVTLTNKSKMSTSKSCPNSKSKTSPKISEKERINVNIADEDQIDAEDAVVNHSQEIYSEKNVDKTVENGNELDKEEEDSTEVTNKSQVIEAQNELSEPEEKERNIEEEQGNENQGVVNDSEEVESEGEDKEEDEENNEDEDEQNESEEIDENQSQEVEDQSEEVENESQEVDKDEGEDEEEIEEAEESEVEEENESQEEMDVDVDDQQESNEVIEESDGQNDAENDNHASQEEISGTDEGTSNITHDTTGRNRKKNETNVKSPEAILHDNTNQMESFTAKGRNTSIRRTSMIKSLNIKPSLAPPRDSTGFSDGTRNSSTEGSGWDSHRITKKTLRQTFGRDFTPRKSLRALVMEKSAKRHTEFNVNDVHVPRANSTELPEDARDEMDENTHDVSKRTRLTTLEMYVQKVKKQNLEKKMKLEEEVRNSLKAPSRDFSNPFPAPSRPFALKRANPVQSKPKRKKVKTVIPLDELPQEFIQDMKYKPPKRFQPSNASWITKRLYKFLESKLEAKYDYKARIRAEKLVESIYEFTKQVRRQRVAPTPAVRALQLEMARLDVVRTHFDFYDFFHEYMPREIRVKVNPDVVNKIPLPRQGVFADILQDNAAQ